MTYLKRKKILMVILVLVLTLSVACSGGQGLEEGKEEIPENHELTVAYSVYEKEEIFGDLDKEEILVITNKIFDKLKKDSKNPEEVIDRIFKEEGIKDQEKIQAAKDKLILSLPKN